MSAILFIIARDVLSILVITMAWYSTTFFAFVDIFSRNIKVLLFQVFNCW